MKFFMLSILLLFNILGVYAQGRSLGEAYGFINAKGDVVLSPRYEAVRDFSEGLAGVKMGGKWGWIDRKGRLVIEPKFDCISDFSEGLAAVCENEKWGYVNRKGEIVIPLRFVLASDFSFGVASVAFEEEGESLKKLKKLMKKFPPNTLVPLSTIKDWGFVDRKGNVIARGFWATRCMVDGLALVRVENGKYGFVSPSGEFKIAPRFSGACSFSEGLAAVEVGERYGYIDRFGKMVIEPRFEHPASFHCGRAAVVENGARFVINKKGEKVFEIKRDYPFSVEFREGLARMAKGIQWIWVNVSTGKEMEKLPEDIPDFSFFDGDDKSSWERRAVSREWGFVDTNGDWVIPCALFQFVGLPFEGRIRVKAGGKYGYINKKGGWVVKPRFIDCGNFHEGLAWFRGKIVPRDVPQPRALSPGAGKVDEKGGD